MPSQIPDLQSTYNKYFNEPGTFVEVGAYDGITHSNTCFLADTGWKGVYIEPIKEFADRCKENHKNNDVEVINVAVGASEGLIKLHVSEDWTTSITNPQRMFANIGMVVDFGDSVLVPMKPLNDVITHLDRVDLLVIDTEGTELDILSTFDFKKWKPRMIIVEMHEQSPEWNQLKWVRDNNIQINDLMSKNGYEKIFSDQINSIFVL